MEKTKTPKVSLMPKVSVIMPTYNRADFIKESILSVLKQNFKNLEIIIVDDGSSDNTRQIINSIKDERIIYIYQKNKGRSAARNKAIEVARGKYLAFLDSDDLFMPGKIKKQFEFLEKNLDYGMVYTSALNINEKGEVMDVDYKATKSGNIYQDIAFYIPLVITLPTVMVKKKIVVSLHGFDEKMRRFEDTDMWRRIAKRYRIYAMKEPLTKIRAHRGNRMEHPEKLIRALDYYVDKIFQEDKEVEWLYKRRAASLLYRHYYLAVKKQPKWRQLSFVFWWRYFVYWPFWSIVRISALMIAYAGNILNSKKT